MTYSIGDGDKLKIRVSQARGAGLAIAEELLKLAAEALKSGDNETSSAILVCSRKIMEATRALQQVL